MLVFSNESYLESEEDGEEEEDHDGEEEEGNLRVVRVMLLCKTSSIFCIYEDLCFKSALSG